MKFGAVVDLISFLIKASESSLDLLYRRRLSFSTFLKFPVNITLYGKKSLIASHARFLVKTIHTMHAPSVKQTQQQKPFGRISKSVATGDRAQPKPRGKSFSTRINRH